jgi:hypothetical protein
MSDSPFQFNPTAIELRHTSEPVELKPTQRLELPQVTMEIEDVPTRRFMAKYQRFEPKLRDATAVSTYKTCARKYFFQLVLGRVPREEEVYFAWGSAYHVFRYVLEKEYGYGPDKPAKFDEAKSIEAFLVAQKEGVAYWKAKSVAPAPGSKWEFMTTERLIKSFVVAFKHWKREKLQCRIEVIAIEQAFNIQMPDGSHRAGRADQMVRWNRKLWGRDFKTTTKDTKFFSRMLEPSEQFTGYTYSEAKLAGEPVEGQFVEVLYNAKDTKNKKHGPEILELTTARTPWQLEEFENDQMMVNQMIKLNRDADRWPMFEPACPFCPYHSVCIKPTEQAMMAQLEMHFRVRPWDCTKVNGD